MNVTDLFIQSSKNLKQQQLKIKCPNKNISNHSMKNYYKRCTKRVQVLSLWFDFKSLSVEENLTVGVAGDCIPSPDSILYWLKEKQFRETHF